MSPKTKKIAVINTAGKNTGQIFVKAILGLKEKHKGKNTVKKSISR